MELIIAARTGNLEKLKDLVSNGANIYAESNNAWSGAASNGHLEVIKYLISQGYDIHIDNDNAIKTAAHDGHLDIVKYIIEKGVSDKIKKNLLLLAAYKGHIKIIKYLVEIGVDIRSNNNNALWTSGFHDRPEIIKYLLIEGANINVLSDENQIKYQYYSTVKAMILFLLDFHFKREIELNKNELADCNVIKIFLGYC